MHVSIFTKVLVKDIFFVFSPLFFGEDEPHFDYSNIFHRGWGWFNHQLSVQMTLGKTSSPRTPAKVQALELVNTDLSDTGTSILAEAPGVCVCWLRQCCKFGTWVA